MSDQVLWSIGLTLIIAGFAISLIGVILLVLRNGKGREGKARGGGVVIIGPVPIIFGTDKQSVKVLLILSIVLVALLLVLTLFYSGVFRWGG